MNSKRNDAFVFVQNVKIILSQDDYMQFIRCISNNSESDDHEINVATNISNIFHCYPKHRTHLMSMFCEFLCDPDAIINTSNTIKEWHAVDGLMLLSCA
jgi:hypothetical protein